MIEKVKTFLWIVLPWEDMREWTEGGITLFLFTRGLVSRPMCAFARRPIGVMGVSVVMNWAQLPVFSLLLSLPWGKNSHKAVVTIECGIHVQCLYSAWHTVGTGYGVLMMGP